MYCQVRPFLGKIEVRFLLSGPSYFSLSWFSFPLLETYISLKAFSGKYWKTIRVMGFGYEAMSYLIKQDVNNSEFKVYWFCGSYHYQISSMNFDLRLVPLGHKMAAAVPDFTFPYWAIERKNKGCSLLYVCFIGERNIYQIVSRRFSPISYQNYVACYLLNKLLGQGKRLLRQIYVNFCGGLDPEESTNMVTSESKAPRLPLASRRLLLISITLVSWLLPPSPTCSYKLIYKILMTSQILAA